MKRLQLPFKVNAYVPVDENGMFQTEGASIEYQVDNWPIAMFPSGRHAVLPSGDGGINVVDLQNSDVLVTLGHHNCPIRALGLNSDAILFSADYDFNLATWDVTNGRRLSTYSKQDDWLMTAAFSGKRAIAGGECGSLVWWDISVDSVRHVLEPRAPRRPLRDETTPADSMMLVFPSVKGAKGQVVDITSLDGSGELALVGFSGRNPLLFRFDQEETAELDHQGHYVSAAALSPDGEWAVTATRSGYLFGWVVKSRQLFSVQAIDSFATRIAISGDRVVIGDLRGQVVVFQLA